MVRTRDGAKMSKSSPETAIDPLEIIPEYGADALRLSMVIGQSPGSDNRLYKEKIAAYRNFCNKLWNVGRFIESTVPQEDRTKPAKVITGADAWMFNKVQEAVEAITEALENYRISEAGQIIYSLLWDDFADWYIEASKAQINGPLLADMYRTLLKLIHPIAPFVTEVLWKYFGDETQLVISEWPTPKKKADPKLAADFNELMHIVSEIRELGNDLQLDQTRIYYKQSTFLDQLGPTIVKMTGVQSIKRVDDGIGINLTKTSIECWLDIESNITRTYLFKLIKRRDQERKTLKSLEGRLQNKDYTSKAPKELVEESKQQAKDVKAYLTRLEDQIENLEDLIKSQSAYSTE